MHLSVFQMEKLSNQMRETKKENRKEKEALVSMDETAIQTVNYQMLHLYLL